MEERNIKYRKIKRAAIVGAGVGMVALTATAPVVAIGATAITFWTLPGVIMSKELRAYEEKKSKELEKAKTLSLNYNNEKRNM